MIPVAVRLANNLVDQHITNRIGGLGWRTVAPGGFAGASFQLQSPIDVGNPLLTPFTRMYVYDARNGETLWEGRLQQPGRSASDAGAVWSLTGIGPSAHASDRTGVLIYIDTDLTKWFKAPNNAPGANVGVDSDPLGTELPALRCQFPGGQPITTSSKAQAGYDLFSQSLMEIGAYGFSWNAGITDTNFAVQSMIATAPNWATEGPSSQFTNGSGVTAVAKFVIDDFSAGRNRVMFRLIRGAGGATTIANDNTWAQTWTFRVLGRRMTKDGTLVSGATGMGSSTIRVFASQVVEDLLGRMLPQYDGANALVTTTSTDIDQLVYPDGVSPAELLDDLIKIEPAFYWAAWESNAAGKYRFEWKPWPTTPRYEASIVDGFDSPAPSFELYNRVTVTWKDIRGQSKTTVRTQVVPELDNNGLVREYRLDLGDEAGSSANATTAGDQFLAEHLKPPSSGTLTVAHPILDLTYSRSVDPWQIRPGELIRVRGVEASVDSLVASANDGQTVFRIVSVEVRDDGTAQLELDMFTPSEVRALINLARRRRR